jgi:hypothetical protein
MTVQHCIDAIDKGFYTVTDKKRLGTCLSSLSLQLSRKSVPRKSPDSSVALSQSLFC